MGNDSMKIVQNRSTFHRAAALSLTMLLCLANTGSLAQTPLSGIAKVVTGNHSCALTVNGTVKCWGLNFFGQLGDNSTTNRLTPVDVISGLSLPPLSGVTAIAAGLNHNCVLINGGVKCWGYNAFGQLGDGSKTDRSTPVDVIGLASGVSAISTGSLHSCALTNLGGVKCWGSNGGGRLGNNVFLNTDSATPVDVVTLPASAPLTGVVAIGAGGEHTCAIMTAGGMKCWGRNLEGQLGIDSLPLLGISRTPLDVLGLNGSASAISLGGQHTCALNSGGGLQCWGYNDPGQVGDNSNMNRLLPVNVSGLGSGVAAIDAGNVHTCALTTTGGAKCWGNGSIGQLGNDSMNGSLVPGDVVGLTANVAEISAGIDHTCFLMTSGGVKCTGFNGYGQLGDNTNQFRLTPVDVILPSPIALSAVKSRKTHGIAGVFDLPLDTTQAIGALVTVESRAVGTGHLIVFQFTSPVATTGAATAVNSAGNPVGIGSVTRLGNEVLVALAGTSDNSRVKITLNGTNGTVNSSASLGFLLGDGNNSRSVDATDLSSVKARSGQVTDSTNYRYDVSATGTINVSDILAVKARAGSVLVP
jgi:alpha-tubulin suppressor-like RCC1 family protein